MGRKKAGKILMTAWLTGSCILTGCSAVSDRQEPVRQTTAAAESAETAGKETEMTQPQPAEAETIESRPAETAETSIRINPQEAQPVPEGMVVWNSLSFFLGEEEWQLTVYVSEEAMERGTFSPDDSCRFLIKAGFGSTEYCFFDEQVQLGTPAADVWTDPDNRLHIVIRDFRTARYRITDYVYDEGEKTFSGTAKMDYDGINYWGSLEF